MAPAIDRLLDAVAGAEQIEARSAFLDLVDPDLTTVAGELAAAGHRKAVVVPLLFTTAFHATVDVPQALAAASAESGLELLLADVLGTGPDVAALLLTVLGELEAAAGSEIVLYAVGSSDAAANAAVHDLAERLSAAAAAPVRVGFGTAEPRAAAVLTELDDGTRPVAVVPLFLAPGRLLDPIRSRCSAQGWPLAAPLAERAAPVVSRRYQDRLVPAGPLG